MRVNVWIPDELAATVRAELPDVNVSRVLREALQSLLACRHDGPLECPSCAATVDPGVLRLEARQSLYDEIYRRLDDLAHSGGSIEGAVRVVNSTAERFLVRVWPDVRLTRASREALRDAG